MIGKSILLAAIYTAIHAMISFAIWTGQLKETREFVAGVLIMFTMSLLVTYVAYDLITNKDEK